MTGAQWDLHRRIYRDLAEYAVAGYRQQSGMALGEKEEAKLVESINLRLVVEEFALLFVAGYLATRPFKWAYRIGKFVARRG